MKITVWGCRGSLPSPGRNKNVYGGNTSCVQVQYKDTCLILDGGSGIQRLGEVIDSGITKIDILLTHLHLDHIMGLGFFQPFYNPALAINIWGPSGTNESLQHRLRRYFSPPLFPVRLKELPCKPKILEVNQSTFQIGDIEISSEYVCHPGPTVGYRLKAGKAVLAYLPDHEPALGSANFPNLADWTSGYSLAKDADILMHDAQYRASEYGNKVGWGHSSMSDAIKFAELTGAKKLLFFHHDPAYTDEQLNEYYKEAINGKTPGLEVEICAEDNVYELDSQ